MVYAIILAGGIGSRFWPLSRSEEPKQFLDLYSGRSMLEETISRISRLINKENIYIATNKMHHQKINHCIESRGMSSRNILFEPEGRNTLAPIGVLAKQISDSDPAAIIVVLPCDHFIKEHDKFLNLLRKAIGVATKGYIVTLGVTPKRPETGYGYIRVKLKGKSEKEKVYEVDRFIEKPDLKKAKKFLNDKRYYWNNGIFIFRADVMLGEIRKITPEVYKIIMKIKSENNLKNSWAKLPSISIDYAIMQRTKVAALIPADYGWMDLGSWLAIQEVLKKDKDGNIVKGKCISIDNKNTMVWSDNRLVAALGLEDIVIVNTRDALLVCKKDRTQDVRRIAQLLKKKNYKKQI